MYRTCWKIFIYAEITWPSVTFRLNGIYVFCVFSRIVILVKSGDGDRSFFQIGTMTIFKEFFHREEGKRIYTLRDVVLVFLVEERGNTSNVGWTMINVMRGVIKEKIFIDRRNNGRFLELSITLLLRVSFVFRFFFFFFFFSHIDTRINDRNVETTRRCSVDDNNGAVFFN